MKTLLLAPVLLASALLAAPAHAQRMTSINGAKLIELCTSKDRNLVEQCQDLYRRCG